jgi:hypothetical protein
MHAVEGAGEQGVESEGNGLGGCLTESKAKERDEKKGMDRLHTDCSSCCEEIKLL